MDDLQYYFGMHPFGALAVVVSTTLLYAAFAAILSRFGQRLFSSPSSMDLAIVTVLGAIVGRAILGQVPTLGGGLLALATLFTIEWLAGRVRRTRRAKDREQHRAQAVMVHGRLDRAVMHRLHVDEPTVYAALRTAGVRSPAEVALLVLERNGRFSVLREGEEIHPALLTGVRHANEVRERLAQAR